MMRDIRSAVITGASSMIGINLVHTLLKKGLTVTAVIRRQSERRRFLPEEGPQPEGGRFFLKELDAGEICRLEPVPCDAFFHLVWGGSRGALRNDEEGQRKNVRYTLEAVQKAKALGAKVFSGAGSQAEYGFFEGKLKADTPLAPNTAYGKAKKEAEEESRALADSLGLDHVWPRILSVYGPYDQSVNMMAQTIDAFLYDRPISFTKGEQIWDYLYAGDCAEALYALSARGVDGRAYPLGKGEAVPLKEYILKVRDLAAPERRIVFGERPYNDHQVMYLSADISDLVRDTGWKPETDFETGIRKTIEWIRTQKNE